jgi:alpha-galactosidase
VTGTTPTGSVTFYNGNAILGTAAVNNSGLAALTTRALTPGWSAITASYSGDATNAPSRSTSSLFQTANPPPGNGKLKVFIVAGQSNMVGYGSVENGRDPNNLTGASIPGGLGSLRHMLNANPNKYAYLADPDHPIAGGSPGWITRGDAWITYYGGSSWELSPNVSRRNGNLDANYGADAVNGLIGPEYGFGLAVGSQLADQVLIIKYAHGGRSLAADFRPPSSGGTVGPCYTDMIGAVHKVLNNIAAEFPAYSGGGYEIAGFGWHQGWNDRVNSSYVAEYEANMVNLIKDLRTEFAAPNMRVSIGNTGMANAPSGPGSLIEAQGNVASPTLHPEFAGTVATVDTRPFDFGELSGVNSQGYHWYWNGESYFNIGESMGKAMMALLPPINTLPAATPQSVTTPENTALPVTLAGSDSENSPLTYTIVIQPAHGTLNGSGSNYTYTPNANYYGPDGFTFASNDGSYVSDAATVSITVTPSPFSTWAADPAQGLTAGVNDGPNDDPDHDGIVNLLEFTLGGAPMVAGQTILPKLTKSGGVWEFEYDRSDLSLAPATTQVVEYGDDLTGWAAVPVPTVSNEVVTITPGTPSDHVKVTIPVLGSKVFVRLKVTQ